MIICLITLSSISYLSIKEHATFNQKIYVNTLVLFEIEALVSDLVDIETSYRGYLLTGNESFLDPYKEATKDLQINFEQLKKNLKESHILTVQLNEIDRLLQRQINLLSLDQVRSTPDSLMPAFIKKTLEEERSVMQDIRLYTEKMKNYQMDVLHRFKTLSDNIIKQNYILIAIFILLTAIIIFLAYISIFRELEHSQALSNKLEESIHRLSRSNEDLEQFAYVASHDLQEPLRKLIAFSDFIKEKYANNLPEEGKDYFNRIIKSSGRMQKLIQDLLNFSRVSKNIHKNEIVDLSVIITEVIEDLQQAIKEKDAKISLKLRKNLKVKAVTFQMGQLFQNLISNALKFTKKGTVPDIRIFSRIVSNKYIESELPLVSSEKYIEITVKDNGIGFDEKYITKIFTIFQRIHGRSEYSGTGIGLALCKKITENHKGILLAESALGKGAVFTVYLPAIDND